MQKKKKFILKKAKAQKYSLNYIEIDPLFQPLINAVIERIRNPDDTRPDNLALYGNTDTGKSSFLENIIKPLKSLYSDELDLNENYGIIVVDVTTFSSIKELYREILRQLSWNYSKSDKVGALENKIGKAVKIRQCKLIVIDEFNQVKQALGSTKTNMLNMLRNLPRKTQRPLIITGTSTINELLGTMSQTDTRYDKIEFPRLQLTTREEIEFFDEEKEKIVKLTHAEITLSLIVALEEDVFDKFGIQSSVYDDLDVIEQMIEISQGKIGGIVKIWTKSVRTVLNKGLKEITPKIIKEAILFIDRHRKFNDNEDKNAKFLIDIEPDWATNLAAIIEARMEAQTAKVVG